MKSIDTLVQDIERVLDEGVSSDTIDHLVPHLSTAISSAVHSALDKEKRGDRATLRMSNIGKPNCQLWYEVNEPEYKEALPPATRMKFLFGHILEEVLLFLAEVSGHKVEGRQDEQEISEIKGHRDAVIDGVLVDVKSASTYSFNKFQSGKLEEDDAFGYSDQLQSYLHAGQSDPLVLDKDRAAFLVVDKTLGNICLDIHKRKDFPFEKLYDFKKEMVQKEKPPRGFDPVPEGKSGNLKLGVTCSYCPFQKRCWPEARTFLYANKPLTLVKVMKEPNVPELRS